MTFLVFSFAFLCNTILVSTQPPLSDFVPCGEVIMEEFRPDRADLIKTVETCFNNISSPWLSPSMFPDRNGKIVPLEVNVSLGLNQLVGLDEDDGLAVLDLFIRHYWREPRAYILGLENASGLEALNEVGLVIPLSELVYTQRIAMPIFIPNLMFIDAVKFVGEDPEVAYFAQIGEAPIVVHTQKAHVSVAQAHFDFSTMPQDIQSVVIRIESQTYTENLLTLHMDESMVNLMSSVPGPDGTTVTSFEANALWKFIGYQVDVVGALASGATYDLTSFLSRKNFDAAILSLDFERYTDGTSYRLGLPMFFLSTLSVLTFFVPPAERLGYGLSVLVSFQAFQIVVKDSIPDLGYATNFDLYITDSNILLVVVCCMHAVTGMLLTSGPRTDRYPTRLFLGKILEFTGRCGALPIAIWLAFEYMGLEKNQSFNQMVYILFIPAQLYIFLAEIPSMRGVMHAVSIKINKQVDAGTKVARISIIYQGFYRYHTFFFFVGGLQAKRKQELASEEDHGENSNVKDDVSFFMNSIGDNAIELTDLLDTVKKNSDIKRANSVELTNSFKKKSDLKSASPMMNDNPLLRVGEVGIKSQEKKQ